MKTLSESNKITEEISLKLERARKEQRRAKVSCDKCGFEMYFDDNQAHITGPQTTFISWRVYCDSCGMKGTLKEAHLSESDKQLIGEP